MNAHIANEAAASSEDCGCAPTPAERDSFWKLRISRRGALGHRALSAVALASFGITSGVSAPYAASYLGWDDFQRVKSNEAAKAAEVTRVGGLVQSLPQKVAETRSAPRSPLRRSRCRRCSR
ncbi:MULTISPECIES: hypothetical protein [unclassified Microbacterium]|uniref:hypothetical protein n=1 Tax=unclassified Microbacterium TaxID=2609290 RepID=UPI001604BDDA|nr:MULTISPECIES: hypothetical protein [unclassified Microbacterium]MDH5154051.1 hypothetical protein [Microbacterium sp. RD06]MDH5131973.1 hypothetical protein [Microbacterium sp. RD10]MDH5135764.1 hypothetical protein [Microbacterium sp. RD11]MDH5143987.1 hypothetical protein [Microbacterium sp. RD12]MDH5165758.1 hypothetical protein [Microbacterium sp. RD02]